MIVSIVKAMNAFTIEFDQVSYSEILYFFLNAIKCIADPTRFQILHSLKSGEKCVCELVNSTEKEQSLISHHLQPLKACGLVENRQEGKNIFYKITDPDIKKLIELIDKINNKNFCGVKSNE